jgi:hypothetical protein
MYCTLLQPLDTAFWFVLESPTCAWAKPPPLEFLLTKDLILPWVRGGSVGGLTMPGLLPGAGSSYVCGL